MGSQNEFSIDMNSSPVTPNELRAILDATLKVQQETGWGKVSFTLKNGKVEDVSYTCDRRISIEDKKRPHGFAGE